MLRVLVGRPVKDAVKEAGTENDREEAHDDIEHKVNEGVPAAVLDQQGFDTVVFSDDVDVVLNALPDKAERDCRAEDGENGVATPVARREVYEGAAASGASSSAVRRTDRPSMTVNDWFRLGSTPTERLPGTIRYY